MAQRLLLDTDVLIDYLRGRSEAIAYLESLPGPLALSAISVAELYAGVRDGDERVKLEQFLSAFDVLPVDDQTAVKGGLYRRDYTKSHSVGLADALIAATAETYGATLVTLNEKHFPMIEEVLVPYQKQKA
jgi:predicted nucleic acid-binding protein